MKVITQTQPPGSTKATEDQEPSPKERLDRATSQLNLVLGFFGRVDTKLSVVLSIDLGMLGLLTAKAPTWTEITTTSWYFAGAFAAFISASLIYLYRGSFPNLVGGQASLVYFREAAKRREVEYIDAFSALSTEDLSKDILCQAWRNSQILAHKFNSLKMAYICMALSIPPWVVALVAFVRATPATPK